MGSGKAKASSDSFPNCIEDCTGPGWVRPSSVKKCAPVALTGEGEASAAVLQLTVVFDSSI